MPSLTNPKHEMFAQETARGKTASDAYRTVFGKDNRRYASALGQREDISGRVQDILAERSRTERQATEQAAEALSIDKQWVMAELVKNHQLAREGSDFGPSNKALELLGKELGMFIDRSESVNFHADISDKPIDRIGDDWLAAHGSAH